jgi:dTDP-4-amino-4,6-dideoxygalactose transaminase
MEEESIEALITQKTKVIVCVHYAGLACDMDKIMSIAKAFDLFVVEDAAQAIDGYYKNKPLGGIGDLGAFSFHETKNIISGEGGMLTVNNDRFIDRSEIIWEKGTNRSAFWRGEVNKYGWVDVGSSFLPSEIVAAFLFAQLEKLELIQNRRKSIWKEYFDRLFFLKEKGVQLPFIPNYGTNNAHMFYLVCRSLEERTHLIEHLKRKKISAVFHYLSLHKSPFYKDKHDGRELRQSDRYENCLVRLPLYYELSVEGQQRVIEEIISFYSKV